ncbi:MAG: hypothetical protein ABN479_12795 [Billgrantia sp.]|uniref:Uncharacterized protein n=1 Tax=Billgrantia desiderata TaxID=52021 RepID=A0ABS9B9Z2_9GAMM|nr:hypothetical protein [Halomonas desiderata]MCE8044513.1 hypothetical protein [Halomonas desiderata]MCE8049053.1 hypothetical protein [Halomonas desiderata]
MNSRNAARASTGAAQRQRPMGKHAMLTALFFGVVWCAPVVALGEGEISLAEEAIAEANIAAWQELDAAHLDDVRGRYVPSSKLELDQPWGVILWDESRGGLTSGSGERQSQAGDNQQHQSMHTETTR